MIRIPDHPFFPLRPSHPSRPSRPLFLSVSSYLRLFLPPWPFQQFKELIQLWKDHYPGTAIGSFPFS